MTPLEKHYANDIRGLNWISNFGWLRAAELGALMFSGANARKQAERLSRSWAQRGLVLERRLPARAGRALVLGSRGVQLLAEADINARTGKDIGVIENGSWRPPLTWKHDLLATQVLVELHRQGFDVLPDSVLRRTAGALSKMPDGLAVRGTQVIWLEVESARKTGPAMRQLAEALTNVANGQAETVCNHRPSQAMVAYLADMQDERGHALSHRERVERAVSAVADSDVPLIFACCTRAGAASIGSTQFIEVNVTADRTLRILKGLEANGWSLDPASQVVTANHRGYAAHIWQDPDAPGTWSYQAECIGWSGPAGYANSSGEAKRCAAALISAATMR